MSVFAYCTKGEGDIYALIQKMAGHVDRFGFKWYNMHTYVDIYIVTTTALSYNENTPAVQAEA